MVRHQTIRRTEKPFPRARMKQKGSEILMKSFRQPAWNRRLNFHRPMHGGECLITTPFQTRQAVEIRVGHDGENNQPCSHEQRHNAPSSPPIWVWICACPERMRTAFSPDEFFAVLQSP